MIPCTLSFGKAANVCAEVAPKIFDRIMASVAKGQPVRLRETRICVDMGNIYKHVEFGGVSVPIYQDERPLQGGKISTRYRVAFEDGGKRHFKPFTNNPQAAEKFALSVAKKIRSGQADQSGVSPEREERIHAALSVAEMLGAGGRKLMEVGVEVKRAFALIDKMCPGGSLLKIVEKGLEIVHAAAPESPMIVNDVLPEYRKHLAQLSEQEVIVPSAWRRFRSVATRFTKRFGTFYFHDVSAGQVAEWFPVEFEVCHDSARDYRSALRFFFNFARNMGALAKGEAETAADKIQLDKRLNAANPIKSSKQPAPHEGIGTFTDKEVERIFAAAWRDKAFRRWIPVLALRFFAGIHLSEICRLKWSDFKPDIRVINVHSGATGKNHITRFVYLSPDNFTHIDLFYARMAARGKLDSPIIPDIPCFSNHLEPLISDRFNRGFNRVLRAVGLDKKKNVARHSFPSHLLRLTHNMSFVSRSMGSASGTVYRHYINHEHLDEPENYFAIRRRFTQPSGCSAEQWLPPNVIRSEHALLADLDAAAKTKRFYKR